MANKYNSLSHTKWLCKYHIVIVPKYRRKVIYKQYRKDLQEIIRTLCKYKGVEILEGHMMPDHVHLLLSIPPKTSVSSFMGYLKGKSALMMFDKHANLKYKFGNRHFWAEACIHISSDDEEAFLAVFVNTFKYVRVTDTFCAESLRDDRFVVVKCLEMVAVRADSEMKRLVFNFISRKVTEKVCTRRAVSRVGIVVECVVEKIIRHHKNRHKKPCEG